MSKIKDRRIVTKASNDGTFEIGDNLIYYTDGSIGCVQAQGWIDPENVATATAGMETAPDKEWREKRKAQLLKELEAIDNEDP